MTNSQHRRNGAPRKADRLDALSADLVRMLDPGEDDAPREADPPAGSEPSSSTSTSRPSAVPTLVKVPLAGWWLSATVLEQGARWWLACATWPAVALEASMKASKDVIRPWLR